MGSQRTKCVVDDIAELLRSRLPCVAQVATLGYHVCHRASALLVKVTLLAMIDCCVMFMYRSCHQACSQAQCLNSANLLHAHYHLKYACHNLQRVSLCALPQTFLTIALWLIISRADHVSASHLSGCLCCRQMWYQSQVGQCCLLRCANISAAQPTTHSAAPSTCAHCNPTRRLAS
jgi:hypothetical protein